MIPIDKWPKFSKNEASLTKCLKTIIQGILYILEYFNC